LTTFVLKNFCRLFDKYAVAHTEHDALVKSTTKIFSNFVAFSEKNNFIFIGVLLIETCSFLRLYGTWLILTCCTHNNKCYRLILMKSIHYFFHYKQNCTTCVNQMTINDASISVLNYGLYSEKFFFYPNWRHCLKVSKSQKHNLKISFEPKTNNFFCLSALAL
jgi:hypothetical protein